MKSKERIITYSIFAILAIIFFFYDGCRDKQEAKLRNEIAKQSGIIQERDGIASQLVTVVNNQRQLSNELKSVIEDFRGDWSDIKKVLKQNNERLLQFSTAYLRITDKRDTVVIYPMDSASAAQWRFTLLYPDSLKPFIAYEGLIFPQSRNIIGNWRSPNPLPITAVLTETSKGVWKSRLIAPEWIVVDSIQVRSLPADKIATSRKISFVGGVGVGYGFNDSKWIFSAHAGVKIKRMYFIGEGSSQADFRINILREF